jgi:NAD(P)-dependent dehydrogenase (short-subunit alcohol dehydrogenase family)
MVNGKRVVLVTGGGQGIGRAIVKRLLIAGMAVAIADNDLEAGIETEQAYADLGPVRFYETDVSEEASVERSVRLMADEFGRLDALANNAGLGNPVNAPVYELPLGYWNTILRTNLTGPFLCVKHCVPHLRRTKGAIVNISSIRAIQSSPHTEAYAASKGGLLALTHALAMSLGPDIRVNCISPGRIDVADWKKASLRMTSQLTDADHAQQPVGRVGRAEDIAAMAAFLISDEAGFITGQNFVVDGGITRKLVYAE